MTGHDRVLTRETTLAAAILVAWGLSLVYRYWGLWGDDLSAVYFAARFAAQGAWDIAYASPEHIIGYGVTPEWDAEAARLGYPDHVVNRYVYPPLWAAVFGPIAMRVDPQHFFDAFLLVHAAATTAAALACLRMFARGVFPPLLLAVLMIASMETSLAKIMSFLLVQPQAIVVALCILALERAQAGRQVTAGVLLAIAASIKISPGLLVLAFVACGMWPAVRAFAVAGAGLLALSVLTSGIEAHRIFLDAAAELDGVVFLVAINASASSFLWLLHLAASGTELLGLPSAEVLDKPDWIARAVTAGALLSTAATLWAVRGVPVAQRIWIAGGMLYLISAVFGGFAWVHYMTFAALLVPGLAGLFPMGRALALVLIFGVMQSLILINGSTAIGAPAPQIFLGIATSAGLWTLLAVSARRAATPAPMRYAGRSPAEVPSQA